MPPNTAAAIQQTPASESTSKEYVLGHSADELHRLETQSLFLAPSTRDFFARVGLTSGMRVLDVGCGCGDVSFLAADLVGPTGEVIGIDRAETAISTATARAHAKGFTNIRFVQCDIDHVEVLAADGLFDAVVGRLIICHQPKPVEALKKLACVVRPGGLFGFQEPEMTVPYWSTTKLTMMEEFHMGVRRIAEHGIMSGNLVASFAKAFEELGITQQRIIRSGAVEDSTSEAACKWLVESAGTVYGIAQRFGFQTPAYNPKTFGQDLYKEVVSKRAAFIPMFWIGAAGRLPAVRAVEN